jgi:hypothetical protein
MQDMDVWMQAGVNTFWMFFNQENLVSATLLAIASMVVYYVTKLLSPSSKSG